MNAIVRTLIAGLLWASLRPPSRKAPSATSTILHVNDLHARLTPNADGLGGFAHVATLLRRERAAAPASITRCTPAISCRGRRWSTMFEGVPVYEVANRMGIDVNTLGNHEFDYGWRKLIAEFLKVTSIETVNANVVNDRGERMLDKAYVVREVGGVRLAIVGALLENLPVRATEMGPWHVAPVVDSLRPVVAEAKERAGSRHSCSATSEFARRSRCWRSYPTSRSSCSGHPHDGLDKELEHDGRIGVQARRLRSRRRPPEASLRHRAPPHRVARVGAPARGFCG